MKCITLLATLAMALGGLTTGNDLAGADKAAPTAKQKAEKKPAGKASAKLVPLNKAGTVLLDVPGKRVLLKTKVVLREGLLEMLVCKKQTKEHESILAIDAQAFKIHTGLLALGAKVGKPAEYLPKYKPATGQRIDIFLQWTDKKGKRHRVSGQSWVRHAIGRIYTAKIKELPDGLKIPEDSELRYDKKFGELTWFAHMTAKQRDALLKLSRDPKYQKAIQTFYKQSQPRQMESHWIFPGSGFYVDDKTGEKTYRAEGGDVICVANFSSAMLDVAVQSSAEGESNLLFEAFTKRIPPLDTEVTVELVPVFEKKKTGRSKK